MPQLPFSLNNTAPEPLMQIALPSNAFQLHTTQQLRLWIQPDCWLWLHKKAIFSFFFTLVYTHTSTHVKQQIIAKLGRKVSSSDTFQFNQKTGACCSRPCVKFYGVCHPRGPSLSWSFLTFKVCESLLSSVTRSSQECLHLLLCVTAKKWMELNSSISECKFIYIYYG